MPRVGKVEQLQLLTEGGAAGAGAFSGVTALEAAVTPGEVLEVAETTKLNINLTHFQRIHMDTYPEIGHLPKHFLVF